MSPPATHQPPHILLGTANWGSPSDPYNTTTTPEQAQRYLDILKHHNLKTIDTSRNYPAGGTPGTSEILIGSANAASQGFRIDSKADNYRPGDLKYENVLSSIDNELSALKTQKLRIQYLHWPDRSVPLEEPLRAINEAYKQGKFETFGISNYAAKEVEQIIAICDREGCIKPTVYQGQYNALCRRGEKQLFPTLRKYGFSFFAWSPAAGGAVNQSSSKLTRKVSCLSADDPRCTSMVLTIP